MGGRRGGAHDSCPEVGTQLQHRVPPLTAVVLLPPEVVSRVQTARPELCQAARPPAEFFL